MARKLGFDARQAEEHQEVAGGVPARQAEEQQEVAGATTGEVAALTTREVPAC